jgi:prephenate dehydratase
MTDETRTPAPRRPRVAIQGERGAFSEVAALTLLGEEIEVVPCPTFESLFRAPEDQGATYVLAPIENSLVGTVLRSQDLLLESDLGIVGEVIIPIEHHLIGIPGSSLASVQVVESHPVALAQCERFFAAHPGIRRVAADDTAGSVRQVMSLGDPTRAAIASRRAAELYGGVILREHLQDHRENYTRFLLLGRSPALAAPADKLSLSLRVAHRSGSLLQALEPFARRGINLLKIESRPIHGRPWQYRFHLDLAGSLETPEVGAALDELRQRADEVRVLGCYPSAAASGP